MRSAQKFPNFNFDKLEEVYVPEIYADQLVPMVHGMLLIPLMRYDPEPRVYRVHVDSELKVFQEHKSAALCAYTDEVFVRAPDVLAYLAGVPTHNTRQGTGFQLLRLDDVYTIDYTQPWNEVRPHEGDRIIAGTINPFLGDITGEWTLLRRYGSPGWANRVVGILERNPRTPKDLMFNATRNDESGTSALWARTTKGWT